MAIDEKTYRIKTDNDILYWIVKKHGSYYVSRSGHGDLGTTNTLEEALAIIKADSGSGISSIT